MPVSTCNCRKCSGGVVYYLGKESFGNSQTTPLHRFVPVNLKSYQYTSKVDEFRREDIIKQCFVSEETAEIDALYAVPIEEAEADIIIFGADMNGRRFYNVVKEGRQGTSAYTSPVICMASLAKVQDEATLEVFKIRLGKLAPGSAVTIAIKYIWKLPASKTVPYNYFSAIVSRLENFVLCGNSLNSTILKKVIIDDIVSADNHDVCNCGSKTMVQALYALGV